jgi:hypothetical protein
MTALDLQAELERWINWNENASEPVDFRTVIKEQEEKGVSEQEVRRTLKEMGFIVDDYGVLSKTRKMTW